VPQRRKRYLKRSKFCVMEKDLGSKGKHPVGSVLRGKKSRRGEMREQGNKDALSWNFLESSTEAKKAVNDTLMKLISHEMEEAFIEAKNQINLLWGGRETRRERASSQGGPKKEGSNPKKERQGKGKRFTCKIKMTRVRK